jgi:putative transposase
MRANRRNNQTTKRYINEWHILLFMTKGYESEQTSVHFMNYHFVWCPKYRRKVIIGQIETRLKELIEFKTSELGCKIIALEVMPDHVHLFIQGKPKQAPNLIIGQIKGFTSKILRDEFPVLKSKLPTLWTRSYFVSTHGHVSNEVIKKYIAEQKGI